MQDINLDEENVLQDDDVPMDTSSYEEMPGDDGESQHFDEVVNTKYMIYNTYVKFDCPCI